MAETVGALIFAGIEAAGAEGAVALGETTLGLGLTVNALVGSTAILGDNADLKRALKSEPLS